MDPVPDPLLLRKSGSAGNRTRDLWICSNISADCDAFRKTRCKYVPIKRKVTPGLNNYAPRREDVRGRGCIAPPFLAEAIYGGKWLDSRPRLFDPRETVSGAGTHWIVVWMGPSPSLHVKGRRKIDCPYRESNHDSSAVLPV
jgi:hypothetical protein